MSQRSPITTHVLDTAAGRPAAGVELSLSVWDDVAGKWKRLANGVTNSDGRVIDLLEPGSLQAGMYRISFETGKYYAELGQKTFYPYAAIPFNVENTDEHYHVPLLLSPYGFSTYRGS